MSWTFSVLHMETLSALVCVVYAVITASRARQCPVDTADDALYGSI